MSDVTAAFIMVTREGKGSEAAKTIDYYIEEVSDYLFKPILEIFAIEGAPFLSTFDNHTKWVEIGQKYIDSDIGVEKNLEALDSWEAFSHPSGNFSHAKPNITDTTVFTYSH